MLLLLLLLPSLFAINLKEMKRRKKSKIHVGLARCSGKFFLVLERNERISSKISVNDINNMISTILSINCVCSLVNDFTQLRGFVCVCQYTLYVCWLDVDDDGGSARVYLQYQQI